MFTIQDEGFQIRFQNGYTVSVQWGPGTYSSEHSAEIAVFNKAGVFEDLEDPGWKSPEEIVAKLMEVSLL